MQLTILSKLGLPLADALRNPDESGAQVAGDTNTGHTHASFAEVLGEGAEQLAAEAQELSPDNAPADEPAARTAVTEEDGEAEPATEADHSDLPNRSTSNVHAPELATHRAEERFGARPKDPVLLGSTGRTVPSPGVTPSIATSKAERADLPSRGREMAAVPGLPVRPQTQGNAIMSVGIARQTMPTTAQIATKTDPSQSPRPVATTPTIIDTTIAPRFGTDRSIPLTNAAESSRVQPDSPADSVSPQVASPTRRGASTTSNTTAKTSPLPLGSTQSALSPPIHESVVKTPAILGKSPVSEAAPTDPSPPLASRTAPVAVPHTTSEPRATVTRVAQASNPPLAATPVPVSAHQPRAAAPDQPSDSPPARVQGQPPAPAIYPAQISVADASLSSGLASVRLTARPVESPGDEQLPVSELRFSAEQGAALKRPTVTAPTMQPGTPRHVAAQITEAIQRAGNSRSIDLTLNPVELGRVKISLHPSEGVMLVNVVAERGETLDLMRRHAEVLAEDLHAIGYDDAQFSFSQHSSGEDRAAEETAGSIEGDTHEAITSSDVLPIPPVSTGLTLSDRVDIRV